MKILPLLIGLFVAADIATGQNTAFHTFTPPPLGSDIEWPASILDTDTLEYSPPAYLGSVRIVNQTNNPIFFDDNYVASDNSPLIDGNAMWGDARTGFPLGDPELTLDFSDFFTFDEGSGDPIDAVMEVSFDFAWASSSPGATLDTLEIEIEDYWGGTDTTYVNLTDTFPHGLGGLGEGRTGRVTLIPGTLENIYSIRILNLRDGDSGGYINEYAIDNLSVGGGLPPGGELGVVDYDGQPVADYGTNVLKNTGIFGFSEYVFNGTPVPTNIACFRSLS